MNYDEIRRRDWVWTYIEKEQALTLVEWLKGDDWSSTYELDKRLPSVGITWSSSFSTAAARAYEIHGFTELESTNVARRTAEAFMRPSKASSTPITAPADAPAPQDAYGFTPRR
ncbi:hypothetical protein [Mesorhizobium escarrei]|uniref:Uncharacterized protein n=1 Tax=Mesorhizobium escarrei TaxID=666018 RepID=A0ABN8JSF9_9HYPH|nr:hypothetical protein [Mesorhizobium escarrei]CAH2399614.1 conserved hypothetical protein [Mesorhizobium escarrei]